MKKGNIHNIKDSGFTVPKDYFKDFEEAIINQSKARQVPKNTGFVVPDAYFVTIENKIINQVSKRGTDKVFSLLKKRTIIFISSIAAAILLLFNLSIFDSNSKWDTLDLETVENYLINEDVGTYEIASTLDNIDFSEENFVNQHVNENTMETYLLENMDIEDLLIE